MTQVAPVETKPAMEVFAATEATVVAVDTTEPPKPKMVSVKLLRNYVPMGAHEIVGWHRPEKKVKDTHGVETVIEAALFIKGEAAPPPAAGVGFANKLWAGTVLKVPVDEAKRARSLKIAEIEIDDD